MDIDLSTIILAAIFITAMVLPFWLISASIRKRKTQMKKTLQNLGVLQEMDTSDHEIWNMNAVAIDQQKKKLLFVRKGTKDQEQVVDISQVLSCKISKGTVGKPGTEMYKIIKVDIYLRLKTEPESTVHIPIFDVLYDDPVEGNYHLLLAKRWQEKVERAIKTTRTRHAA